MPCATGAKGAPATNPGQGGWHAQDREKLEMEEIFRKSIPEGKRLGTRFVFR